MVGTPSSGGAPEGLKAFRLHVPGSYVHRVAPVAPSTAAARLYEVLR
jgi:hypothetical protein